MIELSVHVSGYAEEIVRKTGMIRDGDISFPYELLPGRAGTRNAIRLLALMGYDKEITERAATQAEDFIQTGKWSVQTLLGNT